MSRWQAWFSHLLTVLVSLSGIVYFSMKYGLETDDPFAVVNHPLEPFMLDIHVFTAPVLVFVLGLIFEPHIMKKIKSPAPSNRLSGWITLATFAIMALSGYLLQVTATPFLAWVAWILHLASSFVFVSSYVVHQIVSFRIWVRQWASTPG